MQHLPVLYEEVLAQMALKSDGIYLDCTFGRGGHSRGILSKLGENGRLLAMDQDETAITSEEARQLQEDQRFSLTHGCFSNMDGMLADLGLQGQLDGVLMDIGVSSPQLDDPQRGFSFSKDGPLDMRMNKSAGVSAADWLKDIDEKQLVQVLFDYGEERFARKIASAIVTERKQQDILSTRQLATLIEGAMPFREKHKHPATRSFQAIRIAVNRELDELNEGLQQAVNALKPEGVLAVISFHSLEDRVVKRFIRDESGIKHNPGRLPVMEEALEKGRLEKCGKAIKPSALEIQQNPRARSAVLRIARKRG